MYLWMETCQVRSKSYNYVSRNQVHRELDNYVSVGTPALQDVNVKWTIELPVVRLKSLPAINEVITSVENRSQAVVHRDEAVEDEDGTIRFKAKAKLTDQHSDSYEDGDDSKTESLEAPLIRVVDSDGNPIVLGEASDAVDEVDTDEEDFLDIDGGGGADALDRDEGDALRPKDTQGRKATPRRSSSKRDRQSDTVKDDNKELEGMMDDELEIDAYGLNEQKDRKFGRSHQVPNYYRWLPKLPTSVQDHECSPQGATTRTSLSLPNMAPYEAQPLKREAAHSRSTLSRDLQHQDSSPQGDHHPIPVWTSLAKAQERHRLQEGDHQGHPKGRT